jgi:hypothetical protein
LSFSAQYQSPNDKLLATLQYNRSEYENNWTEHSLSAVIGNSQTAQDLVSTSQLAFAPTGSRPYTFDSRGVFTSGVISDTTAAWNGPSTNNIQLSHPNGFPATSTTGQPFLAWACTTQWDGSANGGAGGPGFCPESTTRGVGLGRRFAVLDADEHHVPTTR